jgi:hypothetical protein
VYVRQFLPSEKDSPLKILHKLKRTQQGLRLKLVDFSLAGGAQHGLQFGRTGTNWVLPRVAVEWQPEAPENLQARLDAAVSEGRTSTVLDLVEAREARDVIRVHWISTDGFQAPHKMKEDEVIRRRDDEENLIQAGPAAAP